MVGFWYLFTSIFCAHISALNFFTYIQWHGPCFCQTGLEPKRPRKEVADLYINLGATFEDHAEVRLIMWPVAETHSLV